MRRAIATAIGALALGVPIAGCGSDSEPAATEPSARAGEVAAVDFAFEPADTEIAAGETVTWTNTGETIHNVEGDDFFSEAINPGKSYEKTFEKPGSYDYICNLHPTQMKGTIEVTAG